MNKLNMTDKIRKNELDFNCGVYMVKNVVTGDCYVGSSTNIARRWMTHKAKSTHERKNSKLYQAIEEYGNVAFEFSLLEEAAKGDLRIKEDEWISKLHPTYNKNRAIITEDIKKYRSDYSNRWNKNHVEQYNKRLTEYYNRECEYEGKIVSYGSLVYKFRKLGFAHPTAKANEYVIIK